MPPPCFWPLPLKIESEASQTLKGIISDDQIQTLLSMTHEKDPHSYVLVYTELVDDNLMIAFTGHWNIKKIEEINANPEMSKECAPAKFP